MIAHYFTSLKNSFLDFKLKSINQLRGLSLKNNKQISSFWLNSTFSLLILTFYSLSIRHHKQPVL
ncbi:MAG: hypothetical protein DRJ11_11425 [Candidatus Aminicenantes bacterium]|nr:MAG: hypothetical protein DRJ11_11425 [Candidatus Aminicenantes bacterium]